jgi:hypothetical protein
MCGATPHVRFGPIADIHILLRSAHYTVIGSANLANGFAKTEKSDGK